MHTCERNRIVYLTESQIIHRNQSYFTFRETSFPTENKSEFSEFTAKNGGFTIVKQTLILAKTVCPSINLKK